MTSQSLTKGADVLQKYDYSYGQADLNTGSVDATKNNGQLSMIEGWIGANKQWSQRFAYDELGRLSEAREYKQGDNAQLTYKQKFEFDRFGNMYRKAASNGPTGQQNPLPFTPIEDADISKSTNRFTTGTTYDEAGQVVNDAKFRNIGFAYDANGRQVKASKTNSPDAWTVYDALGNRVATKVNDIWQYVVYDAFGKLVAEYGIASEGTGGIKYIQQDWQGSVRTVSNNNGFVTARTDYTSFGEEIPLGTGLRSIEQGYSGDSPTRQGYGLTEKDDATGLNHAWFRKNETQAGRWTSPDPYKGSMSTSDPQSFNRYSYVGNDPTNFVDPTGLTTCFGYFVFYLSVDSETGKIISVEYGGFIPVLCWEDGPSGGGDAGGGTGAGGNVGGQTGIPDKCKAALKKAKLLTKVTRRINSPIINVDEIGDQDASKYFGRQATGLAGDYFDDNTDPGGALTHVRETGKLGSGRTGIYRRGGASGMTDALRLHEVSHLALPRGPNLDITLANRLKVKFPKGRNQKESGKNASDALDAYFENGCS